MPRRIDSLLELDYPPDRRHILIISDASTDRTDDIVRSFAHRGVELLRLTVRGGKTAAENAAAARLQGEVVVNTDATIRIVPGALRHLVAAFQDPTVGVASGRDVSVGDLRSAGNQGESGYVGYEMWVRSLETTVGGIVGASGCFFATRRVLYEAAFPEALSRDFASCLIAREQGYRAVSVDAAIALVPRACSLRVEYRRKVRTMARGLSTLAFKRHLLNPARYGAFSVMLISHKLCRWLFQLTMPLLVAAALLAALAVPRRGWMADRGCRNLCGGRVRRLVVARRTVDAQAACGPWILHLVECCRPDGLAEVLPGRTESHLGADPSARPGLGGPSEDGGNGPRGPDHSGHGGAVVVVQDRDPDPTQVDQEARGGHRDERNDAGEGREQGTDRHDAPDEHPEVRTPIVGHRPEPLREVQRGSEPDEHCHEGGDGSAHAGIPRDRAARKHGDDQPPRSRWRSTCTLSSRSPRCRSPRRSPSPGTHRQARSRGTNAAAEWKSAVVMMSSTGRMKRLMPTAPLDQHDVAVEESPVVEASRRARFVVDQLEALGVPRLEERGREHAVQQEAELIGQSVQADDRQAVKLLQEEAVAIGQEEGPRLRELDRQRKSAEVPECRPTPRDAGAAKQQDRHDEAERQAREEGAPQDADRARLQTDHEEDVEAELEDQLRWSSRWPRRPGAARW